MIAGVLYALPSFAAAGENSALTPPVTCVNGVPGGVHCITSKHDLKEARVAFEHGEKLAGQKHFEDALADFDEAVKLAPQDVKFLTAREVLKSHLAFDAVERGNALLLKHQNENAAREFRAALDMDPDDEYARERLQEALSPPASAAFPALTAYDSGEIHLHPRNEVATFHYSGDVRGLFEQLASAYGTTPEFDDSVRPRQVRFSVSDVDFFTALRLACDVSKTMWTALDTHQFLVAEDTLENHKQFDRMSLRTFILPAHSTPQETTEFVLTLRNMFDLRYVNSGQTADTVEVRAPQSVLDACAKLMEQISDAPRPQVMLDIQVFQIDHQLARNIGLHIPDTFNLYNIPIGALAALGGASIQSLINQLISSGGINQAGSSSLSALLAQLTGQQNNIFSQPLATFGGGLTFMGLSLDQLSAALSVNESWSRDIEHLTMRAAQGTDATFHLGTRYPILNASYAPIYNSPQISQVLGNQSYVAPFPSVSYEDLGLNVKAKPEVYANGDVRLRLELQVRSLTGQSNNGVPIISNREYQGDITLADGEPAVVAGQISMSDTLSMSGIPGLGFIPGLNQAMVTNTKQEQDDELLVIITPHVVSNFVRSTPEIWVKR